MAEDENGVRVSDVASKYGMPRSTISTFLKNMEMINAANVAKGYKFISRQRPQIIEEVNKLLLVFINEKQLKGDSLSEVFICEKALDIYDDQAKKTPGTNSKDFDLKASRGWLKKLRKEVQFIVYIDMERWQVQTRKRQNSLKRIQ